MVTVGKLIELLSNYNSNDVITNEQNLSFVHLINTDSGVILSTTKPIGICNRSGEYVYPSVVEGYVAFSPAIDEDLYEFEFTRE